MYSMHNNAHTNSTTSRRTCSTATRPTRSWRRSCGTSAWTCGRTSSCRGARCATPRASSRCVVYAPSSAACSSNISNPPTPPPNANIPATNSGAQGRDPPPRRRAPEGQGQRRDVLGVRQRGVRQALLGSTYVYVCGCVVGTCRVHVYMYVCVLLHPSSRPYHPNNTQQYRAPSSIRRFPNSPK